MFCEVWLGRDKVVYVLYLFLQLIGKFFFSCLLELFYGLNSLGDGEFKYVIYIYFEIFKYVSLCYIFWIN